MCGILFCTRHVAEDAPERAELLRFLHSRGPDAVGWKNHAGLTFVHTLLSMTGEVRLQPFVSEDGKVIAMFNGEIYNYRDFGENFASDGECLLPAYERYGLGLVDHLDGEFGLLLVDLRSSTLLVSTDTFATKPVYVGHDARTGHVGVASYAHPLRVLGFGDNVTQLRANTTLLFDLEIAAEDGSCARVRGLREKRHVHAFDLRQHKTTYADFDAAFAASIEKRTRDLKHGVFIGLSSGYDSGAIACELERQKVPFTAYTIEGMEDPETLRARMARLPEEAQRSINITSEEFAADQRDLEERTEPYVLRIDDHDYAAWVASGFSDDAAKARFVRAQTGDMLATDNGAIGMHHICREARSKGQLVYLSGGGADEVFSDYGYGGNPIYRHSTFGGLFPDDLTLVFPWKDFFHSTQRAYLMKEEYVSGANSVEGRYPFLDRQVVQEFLWLVPELKNRDYKAPLANYLTERSYPFAGRRKVGFNCGFTGVLDGFQPTGHRQGIRIQDGASSSEVERYAKLDLVASEFVAIGRPDTILPAAAEDGLPFVLSTADCPLATLGESAGDTKHGYQLFEDEAPLGADMFRVESSQRTVFRAADGSDPRTNGRRYTLRLLRPPNCDVFVRS